MSVLLTDFDYTWGVKKDKGNPFRKNDNIPYKEVASSVKWVLQKLLAGDIKLSLGQLKQTKEEITDLIPLLTKYEEDETSEWAGHFSNYITYVINLAYNNPLIQGIGGGGLMTKYSKYYGNKSKPNLSHWLPADKENGIPENGCIP